MDISNKRSWHLEIAEATKLKPNLIPTDIFFQFKKNQPYRVKKGFDNSSKHISKPPKSETKINRELSARPSSQFRLRTFSRCSSGRNADPCDSSISKSSLDMYKIEKSSAKILNEIEVLLDKENYFGKEFTEEPSRKEKSEALKEYKKVSQRISLISHGRVPLRNLKFDMYRKIS